MAIVWFGFTFLLNLGMRQSTAFVDSLPPALLRLDLTSTRYANPALTSLTNRATNELITPDQCATVTDQLLTAKWRITQTDAASEKPEVSPDLTRLVHDWLTLVCTTNRISADQLERWIDQSAPPLFTLDHQTDTPGPPTTIIKAAFGRVWQVQTDTPYKVDALRVDQLLINGEEVPFQITETDNATDNRGYDTTLAEYMIQPDPPLHSDSAEIEIHYRLRIYPTALDWIGPFIWNNQ